MFSCSPASPRPTDRRLIARGPSAASSGSVTTEYLWIALAIATVLAGFAYVHWLGIATLPVPEDCTQREQINALFALRVDLWILSFIDGGFGAILYQLVNERQWFLGRNWARLLLVIILGMVFALPLLRVDQAHANFCLNQGLGDPADQPCRVVAPLGCLAFLLSPGGFFQRFTASSLVHVASFFEIFEIVLLCVLVGWLIRYIYFAGSAGRLWASS